MWWCYKVGFFDRKRIINSFDDCHFCKYQKDIYHFKIRNNLEIIVNELLGEIVSEYFKLDTVKTKLYKNHCWDGYVLMTKMFDVKGYDVIKLSPEYFTNVKIKDNVGLDNLKRLENIKYKDKERKYNVELLKLSLKKMIIRDLITNQTDRHENNFLFKVSKNEVIMLPLFDYEHSFFHDRYEHFYNLFDFDLNLKKVIKMIRIDDEFQELLYRAMDLNIYKIIYQLQDEYPVVLHHSDMVKYSRIISDKKEQIKKYKLIR